ncbi:putative leader peptide [Marinactinospora rubrisoli]|uniref:Leader peptide n=1 Tax=Marinactinospora rubrisoli TaxID=2715399 RepID=A0ABW2KJF1_9ACTN
MTAITLRSAPGVRLAGRPHVDLLRVASALCRG